MPQTSSPSQSPASDNPHNLRSVDRELLIAMRRFASDAMDCVSVGQLTQSLGVTATAVRQRIERLLTMGLIEREKVSIGRGRPMFGYRLTVAGHRSAGANANALADAMWREILEIDDAEVRQQLITAIAVRLGRNFAADTIGDQSELAAASMDVRMQKLSKILASRHVVNEVTKDGDLPVLDIGACPYPTLTDTSEDRSMCRLEEQMFSEALGQKVHLSSCRLDGDSCCQFSPVDETPSNQTPSNQTPSNQTAGTS